MVFCEQVPPRGGMDSMEIKPIPQALRYSVCLLLFSFIDHRIGTLAEEEFVGLAVAVAGKQILLFASVLSDKKLVVAHQGLRRHIEFRIAACVEVGEAADRQVRSRAQTAIDVLESLGRHHVEHLAAVALDELDAAELALDFRDALAIHRLEDGDEDKHIAEVEILVARHHGIGKFADSSVGIEDQRSQGDVGLQLTTVHRGDDGRERAVADLDREDDLGTFSRLLFGEIHTLAIVQHRKDVVIALVAYLRSEGFLEFVFQGTPNDGTRDKLKTLMHLLVGTRVRLHCIVGAADIRLALTLIETDIAHFGTLLCHHNIRFVE